MTHKSEMTTDDGSVLERGHLTVLTVIPVWEWTIIYPRASIFLDERDHGCSKDFVGEGGCCPELPICRRKYRSVDRDGGEWDLQGDPDRSSHLRTFHEEWLDLQRVVVDDSLPAVQPDSKIVEFGPIPLRLCR